LEHLDLATFYTDSVQDASREITATPKFDSLSLSTSRQVWCEKKNHHKHSYLLISTGL